MRCGDVIASRDGKTVGDRKSATSAGGVGDWREIRTLAGCFAGGT